MASNVLRIISARDCVSTWMVHIRGTRIALDQLAHEIEIRLRTAGNPTSTP